MKTEDFRRLTEGRQSPPWKERALQQAFRNRKTQLDQQHSRLGSDVAEAPLYGYVADALAVIASGCSVSDAIAWADAQWRTYAKEQQARVEKAKKLRKGPRAGQSSMEHRWVSEEAFGAKAIHIRRLVEIWEGQKHVQT